LLVLIGYITSPLFLRNNSDTNAAAGAVCAWRVSLDDDNSSSEQPAEIGLVVPIQSKPGIRRHTSRARKGWSKQPLNAILGYVRQRSSSTDCRSIADKADNDDDTVQQLQHHKQQQHSVNSDEVYTDDTKYTEFEDDFELTPDSLDDLQQHAADNKLTALAVAVYTDASVVHDTVDGAMIESNDDVEQSDDYIEVIDESATLTQNDADIVDDVNDNDVAAEDAVAVYAEPLTVSDISDDDDDINDDVNDDNAITAADNNTTTSSTHDQSIVSKQLDKTSALRNSHSSGTLATAGNARTPPTLKGKQTFALHLI
jgi:hypothetical protein